MKQLPKTREELEAEGYSYQGTARETYLKCGRLAHSTGIPVFLVTGPISNPNPQYDPDLYRESAIDTAFWPNLFWMFTGERIDEMQHELCPEFYHLDPWNVWSLCPAHGYDIRRWVRGGAECHKHLANPYELRLLNAYRKARTMRFEHDHDNEKKFIA